jgi:hypothetical protein
MSKERSENIEKHKFPLISHLCFLFSLSPFFYTN